MRIPYLTYLALFLSISTALITLESIRDLTRLTDDLRGKIEDSVEDSVEGKVRVEGNGVSGERGQVVFSGRGKNGDVDEGEVEDVSPLSFLGFWFWYLIRGFGRGNLGEG